MSRAALVLIVVLAPAALFAQGTQTGEIRGVVSDASGAVVPEAAVSVSSPALQGARSTTTDAEGAYIFRGLPPGTYTATFTRAGFATAERIVEVPLGSVVDVDVSLTTGPITEQLTVVGRIESAIRDTQVSGTIAKDLVDILPLGRSPSSIASIMPGLTTNTPNAGQLAISGAFAYDNVFLVDGTDVNDNLFGTADALFVEDAIDQVQVLTNGISAEYGRFSGGVINVITRSGGNTFAGTFRETLTNPAWVGRTPFEESSGTPHRHELNTVHEATFEGPIVRNRLWFFSAGDLLKTEDDRTFPQTGIPYVARDEDKAGQIKLTWTVKNAHTISGQYFARSSSAVTPAFGFTIDPAAIMTPRYPRYLVAANYRGTLGSRTFVEIQSSRKHSGSRQVGGTSTSIVDSPIVNPSPLGAYNAPYFDASDPEDRDNGQASGSLSYYFSRSGQHDVKAGAEYFNTTNRGGNSQTATGFVFDAEYLSDAAGRPVLDASGRLIPVFAPRTTSIENWLPVKGARIDIRTLSLYARDHWALGKRVSVDLGTRLEVVRSEATGEIVGVDTRTIVPRLGVAFDPTGSGSLVLKSTYGHYAGKYSEAQFSTNTNVGNPDALYGVYVGPPGQGRDFAPGFNPANYVFVEGSFPTANVFFDEGLSSPVGKELTLQVGRRIGRRAYANVVYAHRHVTNFVEDFVTLDTGSTLVSKGGVSDVFSNIVFRNSDLPKRRYQALMVAGRYMPTDRWTWDANWTVQLKNEGNFEGEAANQPGVSSPIGEYPEAFNEARHYPIGRLDDFQRHAFRVMSEYRFEFGRLGGLALGGYAAFYSPLTYSLRAGGVPLSAVQRERLREYVSQPTSQTLYFAGRGSEEFEPYSRFHLAATYRIPVFDRVRPWVKLELFNVLGNRKLVTWNTTVVPDPASPRDELGLPTGFVRGPRFGQPQSSGNYLPPRAFQMALGVRF